LISNCRRVLNVVFFLLGDSPASEFYVPTFRNNRSSIFLGGVSRTPPLRMEQQIAPKRRHIKFRRRGITQKKEYDNKYLILKLFITVCVFLSWCKLHGNGDNAGTCSSSIIEIIRRLYSCAFVGFTAVLIYRNATGWY
jgi:hypothetical protein